MSPQQSAGSGGGAVASALSALVPGGVTTGETRIDGGVLRWVEAGSGRPAVVLEAGAGGTCLSWAPVLPALAGRTRVVAYDRAGLGASDPGPRPPTLEGQVADLAAVIGAMGEGPCVVAGHSWGGLLAQVLAFRHPELVAGLVLVDPAHEDMAASIPRPLRQLMRFVKLRVLDPIPFLLVAIGLLSPLERRLGRRAAARLTTDPAVRSLVVDAYAAGASRSQLQGVEAEWRGVSAGFDLVRQSRPRWTFPAVPVIVLTAALGLPGRLREPWSGLQGGVAAAAPLGRHVVVADAGHDIPADRPDLVARAILDVVEAVAGERPSPASG